MPSRPFKYQALSRDGAAIRLLNLMPASCSKEIEIEIFHVDLLDVSSVPRYEALSYVWGPPERTHEVLVRRSSQNFQQMETGESLKDAASQLELGQDRCTLSISRNLAIALPYFRLPDKVRTIWIDAICIDQDNLQERNTEVGRMGRIYSSARQVVVWLGEESRDSSVAIRTLTNLGSDIDVRSEDSEYHIVPRKGCKAFVLDRDHPAMRSWALSWIAIRSLLNRPWFMRLWVFQEIALATDAILLTGNDSIPWKHFRGAVLWIRMQSKKPTPISDIFHIRDLDPMKSILKDNIGTGFRYSLLNLIRTTTHRLCSDPRDRVFGVLSLVASDRPDYGLGIVPDYSKTIEQVYTELVLRHIESTHILYFLEMCHFPDHSSTLGLPSWVPNLAVQSRVQRFLACDASGNSQQEIRCATTDGHIKIHGVCKGTITFVSSPISSSARLAEILAICNAWEGHLPPRNSRRDRSFALEPFISLLICGFVDEDKIRTATDTLSLKAMKKAYKTSVGTGVVDSSSKEYVRRLQYTLPGRSFFKTEEGSIGLCEGSARPGDQICIALGCSTPLILRSVNDTPKHFEVGGACFVPEMMRGEGLLGPFPSGWHVDYTEGQNTARPTYLHTSKPRTPLDPRAGVFPPAWKARFGKVDFDHPLDTDGRVRDHWFENIENGERSFFDPRLRSDNLKKMGVDIREFILV